MFDVVDRDLPVPATSGKRVSKGCMTKWLRFFFENPQKNMTFTFFERLHNAHVFSKPVIIIYLLKVYQ